MLPEEELVNTAFELLGELLITSDNATGDVVNLLMHKYAVSEDIAGEVVAIAFERWLEVYDPE
jgi:hypothetical protein